MTTTPAEATPSFRDYAAAEVRAHMGRQRLSARALALAVGESHTWATRRINGVVAMSTDDLERIATVLGMSPMALLTGSAPLPPRDGPAHRQGPGSLGEVSTTGRYVRGERHLVAVGTEVTPRLPSPCVPAAGVTDELAA